MCQFGDPTCVDDERLVDLSGYSPAGCSLGRVLPKADHPFGCLLRGRKRDKVEHEHIPMRGFCPSCGHGRREWPGGMWESVAPQVLMCLVLGFMWYEYVCPRCFDWAVKAGAQWDGKLTFGFTGWKVAL